MNVQTCTAFDTRYERRWWESGLCVALVLLALILPLLYPPIPPLVDLLGHMGRFRVELDGANSPSLAHYYSFSWTPVGNLGVDLLVRLIAPVCGLERATKLVVVLVPVLTAAGFLLVAREVHGRIPPSAYLALPFAYGQPFLYGFVNFALSAAFAMLSLALWLRLGRLGLERVRALVFIPASLIIFFAHAFGWGILGLLCLAAQLVLRRQAGRSLFKAGIKAAIDVSPLAGPMLAMLAWRRGIDGPFAWAWFDWQAKMVWLISALRDRWQWLDVGCVAVCVLFIVFAARDQRSRIACVPAVGALFLFGAFVLLPTTLFGSAYADMRLVPFIFALVILSVDWPGLSEQRRSMMAAMALAFCFFRLGSNLLSFAIAADDQERKISVLQHVPTGARVLSLVGIPCGGGWALDRDSHLGSLVIVRKEGFSNDQWLIAGQNGLTIRYRNAGKFMGDPSQLVLPRNCEDGLHLNMDEALADIPLRAFDYVWLIDSPGYDGRLTSGMVEEQRSGGSILFRIQNRARYSS